MIIFLISFITTLIISHPVSVLAQTPTLPSETPKNNDIQKIREAVQQKVKEKLKEITSPTSQKKAFLGKVIQISGLSLTIDYINNPKQITTSTDTVYIDLKRNKSSFEKIKIGQDILVLGYQNQENGLDAKRIIFIDIKELTSKKYNIVTGKIVDISQSSPVIVLVPYFQKDTQFQLKIDTKTELTNRQGNKIKLSDLNTGQKITAVFPINNLGSKTYSAIKIINFDYLPQPTPTPKKAN